MRTYVHARELGLRPWVELEPTDHPLAVEQRNGISYDRIAAVYHAFAVQETANDLGATDP